MQTEELSLKSIKNVLSRAEMKNIMAGSGCCAHTTGWSSFQCGYSTAGEAQAAADAGAISSGQQTFWCCQSC